MIDHSLSSYLLFLSTILIADGVVFCWDSSASALSILMVFFSPILEEYSVTWWTCSNLCICDVLRCMPLRLRARLSLGINTGERYDWRGQPHRHSYYFVVSFFSTLVLKLFVVRWWKRTNGWLHCSNAWRASNNRRNRRRCLEPIKSSQPRFHNSLFSYSEKMLTCFIGRWRRYSWFMDPSCSW